MRSQRNDLVSRYDADPGPWRPMYYPITIPVPVTVGISAVGSMTIQNQPFIFLRVGHQILGNTGDPETTGLIQDGQYLIDFKDELSNYQSIPFAASAAFGQGPFGFDVPLGVPIGYPGTKTLTFRLSSTYTRVLTPEEEYFDVQLVVCGVAYWGDLAQLQQG